MKRSTGALYIDGSGEIYIITKHEGEDKIVPLPEDSDSKYGESQTAIGIGYILRMIYNRPTFEQLTRLI